VRRNLYCPATRKALFDIGPLCRGARRTRPRPTTSATNSSAAASSVADQRRRGGGDRRVMWPTVPGTLRYPLVVPPSPSASSTLRSAARPRTGPPLHRGHHHRPVKRQPNDRPGPRLPRKGLAPLLCPAICGVGKRPDHGPRPHRARPGVVPGDGSHPMSLFLACAIVVANLGSPTPSDSTRLRATGAAGLSPRDRQHRRRTLATSSAPRPTFRRHRPGSRARRPALDTARPGVGASRSSRADVRETPRVGSPRRGRMTAARRVKRSPRQR